MTDARERIEQIRRTVSDGLYRRSHEVPFLLSLLDEAVRHLDEVLPYSSDYSRLKLGFDVEYIKEARAFLSRIRERTPSGGDER